MTDRSPSPAGFLKSPLILAGASILAISAAVGLPALFADMFSAQTNPYTGIFIYMILPLVAAVGAVLVFLGILREGHRRARHPEAAVIVLPKIDLNHPKQRIILAGVLTGGLVALALLSVTSYRAYHFTEGVQFCGQACHQVMKPEFTAYQYSPHARVACVSCHIGPGASWFVRSKITGAYQVYAVLAKKFPRPIATPVTNLRPAQETCEQCHWPAKFFGAQQKTFSHYRADEKNSPWQIKTLIKVGGGEPRRGVASGIHWHMNIKNAIYYIATDPARETIPWMRVVDPEGHVTEYMSTESPMSPEDIARGKIRRMDCVDCHNRPSHIFRAPDRAVDDAFETERLDSSLPYLKREAMRLLAGDYATEAQAKQAILTGLAGFYQKQYPALYKEKAASIHQATETLQQVYSANFFPEMKTDWRAHLDHIGHMGSDGCFRCHDGLHKSREGKVITKDCTACHTIIAQGPPEEVAKTRLQAQAFRHPVDLGMDVTEMKCSTCHTGTIGL